MGFTKNFLSAEGLLETTRRCFTREKIKPLKSSDRSISDYMMSGLAIFSLKFPSLLQFEKDKVEPAIRQNFKNLYGVDDIPSDTSLRERLDEVNPKHIRGAYKKIFSHIQRSKFLERYRYWNNYYILSVDGTGQYSSNKVHCDNCCQKKHRNGKITYYHQLLAGSLVHPDEKVVIPLAPEPIIKSDGDTKNDCERNAGKRFFTHYRREHPHLKTIVVEDALAANYPHLSLLDSLKLSYVVSVKKGDHKYLFDWLEANKAHEHTEIGDNNTKHKFHYYSNVPLNKSHPDYLVNVLEYWEEKSNGKIQYFSWVTQLEVNKENAYKLMRIGRSRWKIENETFNTLKNQGYHFEHNYGHGKKHLCSTLSMLMLLAFLIDQVQQLCCLHYQRARQRCGALYALHEKIRVLFQYIVWKNWASIYKKIINSSLSPPIIDI